MPPPTPMRTLIIDDEPPARRYLRELLGGEKDVVVAGEAASGVEGVDLIQKLSPDIAFLDIQMPGVGGFEMIEQVEIEKRPVFIFVTGYSEYAVKAFEIEAVDYLCKPFDKERLSISIERAIRRLNSAVPSAIGSQWLTRLSIKDDERILFVPVDQILWIEAANKYVVVHTSAGSHIS